MFSTRRFRMALLVAVACMAAAGCSGGRQWTGEVGDVGGRRLAVAQVVYRIVPAGMDWVPGPHDDMPADELAAVFDRQVKRLNGREFQTQVLKEARAQTRPAVADWMAATGGDAKALRRALRLSQPRHSKSLFAISFEAATREQAEAMMKIVEAVYVEALNAEQVEAGQRAKAALEPVFIATSAELAAAQATLAALRERHDIEAMQTAVTLSEQQPREGAAPGGIAAAKEILAMHKALAEKCELLKEKREDLQRKMVVSELGTQTDRDRIKLFVRRTEE